MHLVKERESNFLETPRRNTNIELIQQMHIRYMKTLQNMLDNTQIAELPFIAALEEYTSNNHFPAFMSILTEAHVLIPFKSLEELSIGIKLELKNLVKTKIIHFFN